jgi:hypothetical protein
LEAHALLQRLATVLGLTLEINHFFVSMFGNTLAFSKLPLRDLLMTLKDILGNFLALASDLFKYACQLNADQKYNWHKNLQATENELSMVRHHTERALGVIAKIDGDHLDYEAQLRRLQDVTQRFAPLLCRLDNRCVPLHQHIMARVGGGPTHDLASHHCSMSLHFSPLRGQFLDSAFNMFT